MSLRIPPPDGGADIQTTQAARRAGGRFPAPPYRADEPLPARPPRDVMDAVSAAARVVDDLHEAGRELRFEIGERGLLRIEVRDLDGELVRSIPPSQALAIAAGARVPI